MKPAENLRNVKSAWLFDVDGVLTDPQDKKASPEILAKIATMLRHGEPVAIVTGRSMEWLRNRLLPSLTPLLSVDMSNNLFISGEFGGVSISYKDGEEIEETDNKLSISRSVLDEARNIARQFSESMFFDETKKTMISVEMKDGYEDMSEFKKHQKDLNTRFREIVIQEGIGENFEVHEDTIATNIKNKRANKGNSATQVMEWLGERGISPQEFFCFGDSSSDIQMAQEVFNKKFNVKFVFVGNPEDIKGIEASFPIMKTTQRYEKGTLEFLQESALG